MKLTIKKMVLLVLLATQLIPLLSFLPITKSNYSPPYGTEGVNFELYHSPSIDNFAEQQFTYMANWNFSVVRFTFIEDNNVYPVASNGTSLGFSYITNAVTWASNQGLDIILNYFDVTDQEQGWQFVVDKANWISNWEYIANQFKNESHVIYELMNEPWGLTDDNQITISVWNSYMQDCVDAIRAIDSNTPILIDCLSNVYGNWIPYSSYRSAIEQPITGSNIWYAVNSYSQHWERYARNQGLNYSSYADFKTTMDGRYWDDAYNAGLNMWVGEFAPHPNDKDLYGWAWCDHMFTLMSSYNVSWNAWWWYYPAQKSMLDDWSGNPNDWGEYVQNQITGASSPPVEPPEVPASHSFQASVFRSDQIDTPLEGVEINGSAQTTDADGIYRFAGLNNNTVYRFEIEVPSGYYPAWVLNVDGTYEYNGTHYILSHNTTETQGQFVHIQFHSASYPYIQTTNGTLTEFEMTWDILEFSVNATGTTDTDVHVAEKGEPTSVTPSSVDNGYNVSTSIQQIRFTHSSVESVVIYWEPDEPLPPTVPPIPNLRGVIQVSEDVVFRETYRNISFVTGLDLNLSSAEIDSEFLWLDKSYSASSYTRYCIYGTAPNDVQYTIDRWFPTANSSGQLTIDNPTTGNVSLEFHSPNLLNAWATGVHWYVWNSSTQILSMQSNATVDPIIINGVVNETRVVGPPENVGVIITNMEGCGNWLFSEMRYYNFQATYWDGNGYTDLNEMKIRFYNHNSTVTVVYDQVNDEFTIEAGSGIINLKAGNTTALDDYTLQVEFGIWLESSILDELDVDIYMYCNDVGGLEDGWEVMAVDYFNIYNVGGYSTLETTGNAGRIEGGDVFDLYAYNSSKAIAQVTFRNLQHVKMLPQLTIIKQEEVDEHAFPIVHFGFGIDYCTNEDDWIVGWNFTCDLVEFFTFGERYTNLTIRWYNRDVHVKNETILLFQEHTEGNGGDLGGENVNSTEILIFWLDMWFNRINFSTTIGGRINSYFYPMEDDASQFWSWISGADWGVGENLTKQSMMFDTLQKENGDPLHAQEIKLVNITCYLEIDSSNYTQYAWFHDYDVFDLTISPTMGGVQTPVFDESKVPVMPQGGFLGTLWSAISGLARKIAEALGPIALEFWNAFVGFLDTVFTWLGWPNGFSQLLSWIDSLKTWLVNSFTYLISLMTSAFSFLAVIMTKLLNTLTTVIGQWVTMISGVFGLLGDSMNTGVNLWNDLSLVNWVIIGAILYPIFLFGLWEQRGIDAVLNHLKMVLDIFAWIGSLFISVIQLFLNLIGRIIESIPVIE